MLVKSEGGEAEEIIEEENGILISAMLRQYFMGLLTVGKWQNLADHWVDVAQQCETPVSPIRTFNDNLPWSQTVPTRVRIKEKHPGDAPRRAIEEQISRDASEPWKRFLQRRLGHTLRPHDEDVDTSESEAELGKDEAHEMDNRFDFEILLMRKFATRWAKKAKVKATVCDPLKEGELTVDWTRVIAPVVEGRIKMVES